MVSAAELDQEHHQKPNIYKIDTRVAILETKVDHIDESLKELNTSIKEVGATVTASVAAASARHKLWVFIFGLLGAATVILKIIGVNI